MLIKTVSIAATPRPIPTIIVDAALEANRRDRSNGLLAGNSTAAVHSDLPLLPTVDICTLEFPENYTLPSRAAELRTSACNLRKLHEDRLRTARRAYLEHLASVSGLLESQNARHIRHQRQHLEDRAGENQVEGAFDPRSRMVGQRVVFTNAELRNLNFSDVNR